MSHVIDRSVILAYLRRKTGATQAEALIPRSHVSSVVASEAAFKLMDFGDPPEIGWARVVKLDMTLHPFDLDAAHQVAMLRLDSATWPFFRRQGVSGAGHKA